MYTIDFTEKAIEDLAKLKRDEPNSFKKSIETTCRDCRTSGNRDRTTRTYET